MSKRKFYFIFLFGLSTACVEVGRDLPERHASDAGGDVSSMDDVSESGLHRFELSRSRLILAPGEEFRLFVRGTEEGARFEDGRGYLWEIVDPSIATVSSMGIVKANDEGESRLRVSRDDAYVQIPVQVIDKPIRDISLGSRHACALQWNGKVYCWGSNDRFNALGQAEPNRTSTPTPVAGEWVLTQLSSGSMATCGLTGDGQVVCWGSHFGPDDPQINWTERMSPQQLAIAPGWLNFIGIGNTFMCGLSQDSAAYCWGNDREGALGVGQDRLRSVYPTAVAPDQRFRQLAVDERRVCGLLKDGHTVCWGNNEGNIFLIDGMDMTAMPRTVGVDALFEAIAIGPLHACGIETDSGRILCWGDARHGRLGAALETPFSRPVPIEVDRRFVDVAVGFSTACGLTESGEVWCWGQNLTGILGPGAHINDYLPAQIPLERPAHRLTLGHGTACAIDELGELWCWGYGGAGILGDRRVMAVEEPVEIEFLSPPSKLFAGSNHLCSLDEDEEFFCWGDHRSGLIFPDQPWVLSAPTRIALAAPRALSGSQRRSCAVDKEGRLACWGDLEDFLDIPAADRESYEPLVRVMEEERFDDVDVDDEHGCALTTQGQAYCWGRTSEGRLGVQVNPEVVTTPVKVSGEHVFSSLAVGRASSCGIADGEIYCWGSGQGGDVGEGTADNSAIPQRVTASNSSRFVQIEMSGTSKCALSEEGALYCWSRWFQSNDRTLTRSSGPFTKVRVLRQAYCALTTTGEIFCAGVNGHGLFRTASFLSELTSLHLPFRTTDFVMTNSVMCALSTEGKTYCWGNDAFGEVGQGSAVIRKSPYNVMMADR